MQPVKNLTYVVVSALNRVNLPMAKYDWLEQIAIEWWTELGYADVAPSVKVAHFGVDNGSRIWAMPSDYIRLSKVGYNSHGVFRTLTRMDSLIVEDVCDFDLPATEPNYGTYFPGHFWQGMYYGPMFATGGGYNIAYYKVNEGERQIEFSMDVRNLPNGEALIEYISTGDVCGDTVMRAPFIEPLRNYLIWQMHEFDLTPVTPYGKAKDRERIYHETLYNAKGNICPTTEEILDALWEVSGYSIR